LILDRRSAEGKFDRFGEIATELIRGKVDVIVTVGNDLAREVKRATSTLPIVMATSNDPVGAGLVTSLARPGANVTGLIVHSGSEFESKRMEFLKEATPHIALWDGQ
jgi:putative ABC transport system substrate-binding protein